MASYDYKDGRVRKKLIDEIESNENILRKQHSYKRFDVFRERQEKYVLQRIAGTTSIESVRDMRTFTSINLTRKMIHELASIYRGEPERIFYDYNDQQRETIENHYKYSRVNVNLKEANRLYKLHEQCALKIVPKKGFMNFNVMQPHHYDVLPSLDNTKEADAYIVSSFDKSRMDQHNDFTQLRNKFELQPQYSDGVNQKIADQDDWKKKNKIYYWWTEEFNFKTDVSGALLDDNNKPLSVIDWNEYLNPIGKIPFVDIATEKDDEFYVRTGGAIVEFNIDFCSQISDTVNISNMQGFSQAVMTSVEAPQNIKIGPHSVLWLKVNPNDEQAHRPEFSFVSPSPDLSSSINLSENLLKYFLVSKSINIKNVLEGTGGANSGFERLLMMIEKFEASQDDIDLFMSVEQDTFDLVSSWHNAFRDKTDGLNRRVDGPMLPEESDMEVNFYKPSMIQSKGEHLDYVLKQLDAGLMTPAEAIMEVRNIDEEMAEEVMEKIGQLGIVNG